MEIERGKKYSLDCYNPPSEGIYLGMSRKKGLKNRHLFMVWHDFMKEGDTPVLIGCESFKLKGENELEIMCTRMYFPKINKLEKEYLTELAKKYWNKK